MMVEDASTGFQEFITQIYNSQIPVRLFPYSLPVFRGYVAFLEQFPVLSLADRQCVRVPQEEWAFAADGAFCSASQA